MGEITDDATHASTQTEGCGSQELQFSNACIDRSIPARQVRQMKKKGGMIIRSFGFMMPNGR
jgi:hypothetical protein